MLAKRKIDYYPATLALLAFLADLAVFSFSHSAWLTLLWAVLFINVKGWICAWNHNHQHCRFFIYDWVNRIFELMLGLQTGVTGECWMLHHTRGHHLNYLDQTRDESAWKDDSGRTMGALEYTLVVGTQAYPKALKVGERYPHLRKKLVENLVITGMILTMLCWINWVNALIVFIVPMVLLVYITAGVTYRHHAGLDEEDPYKATYNITDRWYNFCTCNLGYHTAHHVQCGRHWSEIPEFHEKIKHKIPANLYREPGFPFGTLRKIRLQWTLQKSLGHSG